MTFERWLNRVAYGKPKTVRAVPRASDKAANVGVKLFQVMRARPLAWGLKKGRGRK